MSIPSWPRPDATPRDLTILVTGPNGQVGWELRRTLAPLGKVVALGHAQLDLAAGAQVRDRVREIKPNVVVNAAAYTAVDKAESEPQLARAINGVATTILAEEVKRLQGLLVHYSTDYVFDGTKPTPYTEQDQPNPQNVYGRTKLEGEQAIQALGLPHLILRTSWVYGVRGKNFLLTILRLARERDELRIVDDQIGAPTWSRLIAEVTGHILAQCLASRRPEPLSDLRGIYHLTAGGQTSWYGFARAIIDNEMTLEAGSSSPSPTAWAKLTAIPSSEYPTPARRPHNSMLSSNKLARTFGYFAPDWMDVLRLVMEDGGHCKNAIS